MTNSADPLPRDTTRLGSPVVSTFILISSRSLSSSADERFPRDSPPFHPASFILMRSFIIDIILSFAIESFKWQVLSELAFSLSYLKIVGFSSHNYFPSSPARPNVTNFEIFGKKRFCIFSFHTLFPTKYSDYGNSTYTIVFDMKKWRRNYKFLNFCR